MVRRKIFTEEELKEHLKKRQREYPIKAFRLSNILVKNIDKLANKLKTNKSGAIRLSIEEAIEKHLGKHKTKEGL